MVQSPAGSRVFATASRSLLEVRCRFLRKFGQCPLASIVQAFEILRYLDAVSRNLRSLRPPAEGTRSIPWGGSVAVNALIPRSRKAREPEDFAKGHSLSILCRVVRNFRSLRSCGGVGLKAVPRVCRASPPLVTLHYHTLVYFPLAAKRAAAHLRLLRTIRSVSVVRRVKTCRAVQRRFGLTTVLSISKHYKIDSLFSELSVKRPQFISE